VSAFRRVKAIETAPPDVQQAPAQAAGQAPDAAEITAWLLDGRFFTVDPNGAVTVWSPIAADTFGWRRKDIVGEPLAETLTPDVELPLRGGYTGALTTQSAEARSLGAELAFVPIKLSVGYEFNSLLQEIAARSTDPDALDEMKTRHDAVLALVESALASAGVESEDRPAGALVVFRAGAAVPEPAVAGNVVSIADAAGGEEARAQLERARRDAEEGRVEIRNLEGQLEEARRESQRARNEADVARQEASDLRDTLIVAQREGEEARRQLDEARRTTDEVRAASETARIRTEESQREADSLREQLREAREAARGMAGRADEDLAGATRELAEARAEAARHASEVAPLRERYQEAQRELGALRADFESARGEAEGLRKQLDAARSAAAGAGPGAESHELEAVRGRLTRMLAAFDGAPVGGALIAPDGRFLDVSAALCAELGHDKERLLSPEPPAIVHPDDVDSHRELFARMLAGEQTAVRGVRRYLDADGRTLTMRESVALLRDGDGRPDAFVVQLEEAPAHEPTATDVVDAELEPAPPQGSAGLSGETMRRALEDDLFELHCQPLLDLRTNDVNQYELLIRMRSDDGRLILPEAFLGPARRAGLAHAIDRWVVRRAVRLLVANEHVSLEVNLSPEAVHDPELAAMVEEELAATGIDPARLVLEVAGNTAVDSLEETRSLAKRLRALGCKFALDDFRSNFGSFRLVRELPLDYLKLDGELVGALTESRTSQLIVKALVDVAAGTGMSTVAVFVSDEETVRLLRQLGVDYAQGYTVGRPRPVGEVLRTDDPPQLPSG
jgi:PAS domain S-box-containing protein